MPKLNLQFAAQMRASVHHNSQGATAVDTNWHTVALTEEGHCFTWGWNWCGQLGTGGTGNRYTPFRVDLDGQKVVAIAAGYEHTAVVTSSAQAWAWGSNTYGQLGAGKLPRNDLLPVRMNLSAAISVAAGSWHTLLVTAGGVCVSTGHNRYGQLGLGHFVKMQQPTEVHLHGERVGATAAGEFHSAALSQGGDLWLWGWGKAWPQKLRAPERFSSIAANSKLTLAISETGRWWSWGKDAAPVLIENAPPAKSRVSEFGHVPLCWPLHKPAPTAMLGEVFHAALDTEGFSALPCSGLRLWVSLRLQGSSCPLHVGASEADVCPEGYCALRAGLRS